MIAAVCIDDNSGMLFNHRRQSQDRILREDLLREAAGGPLWVNAYSAKQFKEPPDGLRVSPDFLAEAGPGELCFVEDQDLSPWAERLEKLIVYRWNRTYPADTWFSLPLEGWRLERTAEFAGSSHEKITKEVYVR